MVDKLFDYRYLLSVFRKDRENHVPSVVGVGDRISIPEGYETVVVGANPETSAEDQRRTGELTVRLSLPEEFDHSLLAGSAFRLRRHGNLALPENVRDSGNQVKIWFLDQGKTKPGLFEPVERFPEKFISRAGETGQRMTFDLMLKDENTFLRFQHAAPGEYKISLHKLSDYPDKLDPFK